MFLHVNAAVNTQLPFYIEIKLKAGVSKAYSDIT
jgi:hypothetical protein